MKRSTSSASAVGTPGSRRELARLLQHSLNRVAGLKGQAERLRARVAHAPLYSTLNRCMDALLQELQTASRQLAARASALGVRLSPRPARAGRLARAKRQLKELLSAPATLVHTLLAECQACGARLCALMHTARAAHDANCQRVAYQLIRILEKQLWLLRPHVADTAHPFPVRTA